MNKPIAHSLELFEDFIRHFSLDEGDMHIWLEPPAGVIVPGMHTHSDWELRLVLSGRLPWPDGPASTHPPCLLIPPGRHHLSLAVESPGTPGSLLILALGGDGSWTFIGTGADCPRGSGGDGLRRRLAGVPNDVLDALARETELWTDGRLRRHWQARIRSLLEVFMLSMVPTGPDQDGQPGDALTRAQGYIRGEYTRPTLTVAEVAAAAGCTPTHLAHLFRARAGSTVRQAIVNRRLERAQALLAGGRYLVKEAAYLTGWRSPFHFSNAFTKRFGRRPSAPPDANAGARLARRLVRRSLGEAGSSESEGGRPGDTVIRRHGDKGNS